MQTLKTEDNRELLRNRIEEAATQILHPGNRFFSELKRLEKEALAMEDDALCGNVYFVYARTFFYKESFDRMLYYLRKGLYHLLRSEDNETLSRVFNLFAVNAQRLGCYDISYNYYLMGISFVASKEDSLSRAVMEANLADLLAEMGEFDAACVRAKRALPLLKQNRGDVMSDANIIMVTINLCLYYLYAGKIDLARRTIRPLEKQLNTMDLKAQEQPMLWYLLFRINMALDEGDDETVAGLLEEVIARIVSVPQFALFMKDTHRLCRTLALKGDMERAGKLIRAIGANDISEASTYSRMLLSQLQIDYYRATNHQKKLRESYLKRHSLTELHRAEEKQVYAESVKIMRLIEDLRLDREREVLKNRQLQLLSETDALTGLPNRYALNRALDEAFEHALEEHVAVGVGIVDVDFFKQYNDRYGHQKGDECLCMVADALKRMRERHHFFVARYGGDEFVILYDADALSEISAIDEELVRETPVSVSHGYYWDVPDADTKIWDYLAKADERLYVLKRRHR